MYLELGQLSALDEMRIPVWVLRQNDAGSAVLQSPEKDIDISNYAHLIVTEAIEASSSSHNLLIAILNAVGIDEQQTLIFTQPQLALQPAQSLAGKTVLVFGKEIKTGVDESIVNIFQTWSLRELLEQPNKKGDLWKIIQNGLN